MVSKISKKLLTKWYQNVIVKKTKKKGEKSGKMLKEINRTNCKKCEKLYIKEYMRI